MPQVVVISMYGRQDEPAGSLRQEDLDVLSIIGLLLATGQLRRDFELADSDLL